MSRVSGQAAEDATMVDAGERNRPGDPPDGGTEWVRRVKGFMTGGRPTPEVLMGDEFVSERLQLAFPDGPEGEPEVTIEEEVLEVMNGLWKQCLIVRVLGRTVSLPVLTKKLKEMWKPRGGMSVIDLPRQFFMIRFELEDEYFMALTGGPWKMFGSYLLVKRWSPEFNPMSDEIVTTPVWVRLMNIPVNFYHKAILLGIAEGLGTPVRADTTTLQLERARFARVCVEVDLSKALKGSIRVNGNRYFVAYEGLSKICSLCGIYGHLVHNCPKKVSATEVGNAMEQVNLSPKETLAVVAAPSQVVAPVTSQTLQDDEGYTLVCKNGRRPAS